MTAVAITINGEQRETPVPATLASVLQQLGLDPRGVVVEHNRRIVRRPDLAATAVTAGDAIEIVHFVGGG